MATTVHQKSVHITYPSVKAKLWTVPLGRFLFSLIFIMSGMNHFSSASIGYAANQGVPLADILVPISGAMAIVGGLSVLLGWFARGGAVVLLLFLLPVTVMMHDFWNYTDTMMVQQQMIHFMKNITMIGAAVLIAFYGAGPISIDNHRAKKYAKSDF